MSRVAPQHAYASDLELNVSGLPDGTIVELRVLKRLTAGATVLDLVTAKETDRYVQYRLTSPNLAALRNMPLAASDSTEASVYITIHEHAPDGSYSLAVLQKIGGMEMGRVTKRIIVGDHPFVANRNSGEVHTANCDWVNRMSPHNKVAYAAVELAVKRGFNGCRFCLPEFDKG